MTIRDHLTTRHWITIAATWLITQVILYMIYGINTREEALTHISFAENFMNGSSKFELRHLWYFGYTSLLMLIKVSGLPYQSMYVLQLGLSLLSLICFVKIISNWATSRLSVVLSAVLYATCFLIHQWTNYLFTDAVFSFMLVIATYFLLNQDRNQRSRIIFWCLLIILPFFRPVGFLFVVTACLHWLFNFKKENIAKITFGLAYLTVLLFLVYQSLVVNEGYFYPFNNLNAEIICGRPSEMLKYQVVPYTSDAKIVEYFWNNPVMTLRLFSSRLYKTFAMTRSYFSYSHNVVIAVACITYYMLALVGLFHLFAEKLRDRYFLAAGCLLFTVPSVIFCVEWHGRTSVPVLCFVLLLAGVGMDRLLQRNKT